jgi:hypothetical protein
MAGGRGRRAIRISTNGSSGNRRKKDMNWVNSNGKEIFPIPGVLKNELYLHPYDLLK